MTPRREKILALVAVGVFIAVIALQRDNPIAIVGALALLAAVGATIHRAQRDARERPDISTLKVCPDCAETVKAAANVCRHCGYRFDAAS